MTVRINSLNHLISDRVIMPQITNFVEYFQKKALNDPELRDDIFTDRTYIQRKIWFINIVKTLRLIFQMLFVAFFVG